MGAEIKCESPSFVMLIHLFSFIGWFLVYFMSLFYLLSCVSSVSGFNLTFPPSSPPSVIRSMRVFLSFFPELSEFWAVPGYYGLSPDLDPVTCSDWYFGFGPLLQQKTPKKALWSDLVVRRFHPNPPSSRRSSAWKHITMLIISCC